MGYDLDDRRPGTDDRELRKQANRTIQYSRNQQFMESFLIDPVTRQRLFSLSEVQ